MWMYTMTYCCEDCKLKGYTWRGDISAIQRFYDEHLGHTTHFNSFGDTPNMTLERYLQPYWKREKRSERLRLIRRLFRSEGVS